MGRYLITGGAGFIGSHLADVLAADGHRVRVLDDFSTGKAGNLEEARRRGDVEVIQGDIRDGSAVANAARGCDGAFHLAALVSVPQSLADPRRSFEINVGGTVNILDAARRAGIRRVVLASSAAVYGDAGGPVREGATIAAPLTPYGLDKLAAEQYAEQHTRLFGLEAVALRYFNVYGLRQDPASPYSGVISVFADRLCRGDDVTVYGDGEQTRDFVHVSDVARANVAAMSATLAGFTICNIGTGRETTVNRLLESLCDIVGSKPRVERQPARHGDIRHSCADIRRAQELLGYVPRRDLAMGLRELLSA